MTKTIVACISLWAVFAVAGCVVEAGMSAPPSGVAVSGPPPQPLQETRLPPPDSAAVWIAGYWHWTGMQYTWIPGHWEAAPPGARWRAPHYSIREGTYFYEPGVWSSGSREPSR
jgi:WXXGXW repeat (2 copies)